tara:strand:- start:101 stop:430 length:330 start_codon:yes stop_codon:yes gene_type:complete
MLSDMIYGLIMGMSLGQKILAYTFLLVGLYIFVKTGKLRILGRPVIPMKWRITLALFFPVLFAVGLVFGAVILGVAFAMIAVAVILSIFTGRKIKRPRFPKIRINVIKK